MDLLLWRHAEAVEGIPDLTRELTERGQRQAQKVAGWLDKHKPKRLKVLSSPAMRTRQTASAFTDEFEIITALGIEASVADLIAASGWPHSSGACMIVGHQPTLGRLIALLLAGEEQELSVKKGSLWWLTSRTREEEHQTVLRTVISPDFL